MSLLANHKDNLIKSNEMYQNTIYALCCGVVGGKDSTEKII